MSSINNVCTKHNKHMHELVEQVESVQKRAFRIVYNSNCLDYKNFCLIHQLQTLSDRRDIVVKFRVM